MKIPNAPTPILGEGFSRPLCAVQLPGQLNASERLSCWAVAPPFCSTCHQPLRRCLPPHHW